MVCGPVELVKFQAFKAYRKARLFESKVNKAIADIQDAQSPKALDYELKEDLKKRDILTLVYRKYFDTVKYKAIENIQNAFAKQEDKSKSSLSEKDKQLIIQDILNES